MSSTLYVVCNILVDDDSIDPEYGGSRADYFEVRYDGESIRIAPGETLILPEHLANHYAKHLIDYLLARSGQMMHNEALRNNLLHQIILRPADESDRPYQSSDEGVNEPSEGTPEDLGGSDESPSAGEGVDLPDSSEGDAPREFKPGNSKPQGKSKKG